MHLLLRDLIKDTPLVKESRKRLRRNWKKKKKKSTAPGGILNHDHKSFAPQACALPLCYNHSPFSKRSESFLLASLGHLFTLWVAVLQRPYFRACGVRKINWQGFYPNYRWPCPLAIVRLTCPQVVIQSSQAVFHPSFNWAISCFTAIRNWLNLSCTLASDTTAMNWCLANF